MKSVISTLISEFMNDAQTVFVQLSDGKKVYDEIEFRVVKDQSELNSLTRAASEWIQEMRTCQEKNILSDEWKGIYVDDVELLGQVFFLAALAVSPEWKSKLEYLTLARSAMPIYSKLFESVDKGAMRSRQDLLMITVSNEKKNLETPSTTQE